jgi:sugar lactone lactonase YvrE
MNTCKPLSARGPIVALLLLTSLGGCPGPTAQDRSPVASAGPDQMVAAGSTVLLTGTAAADDIGNALAYAWQQTGGTPIVTLEKADTATSSFVAPDTAATLVFELAVTARNGRVATDSVVVTVAPESKSVLYVANFASSRITAYDVSSAEMLDGNVLPEAVLSGEATLLAGPTDLVIDNNGGLLVTNLTVKSITGYADALNLQSINSEASPTRIVTGPATGLTNPISMAYSSDNDLLFVAEYALPTIHVYSEASAADFNGDVAPARNIESADIDQARGINFGANDELYVANTGNNTVAVFAGAGSLNGTVSADRVIKSPVFAGVFDVFLDANDMLYVVSNSTGGNRVYVFTNASSRNGTVAPDATLTVPGADNIIAIIVDSAGKGYITDSNNPYAVYGYDNVATRNGAILPDRTLTGYKTLLASPLRAFLHE